MTENRQFHSFIIVTKILIATHDAAVCWEAKADGRWDRAYGSGKNMPIPDDLQAAIDAEPKAKRALSMLSAQNRFALAFRVHNTKTVAGRRKKTAPTDSPYPPSISATSATLGTRRPADLTQLADEALEHAITNPRPRRHM